MSNYYLDASALAKRYLPEIGTPWLRELFAAGNSNTIWLDEITQVEVAAALSSRHRTPRGIARKERDRAVRLSRRHGLLEYRLVPATPPIIEAAIELTQRHLLRGYDAVQLATALAAAATYYATGLPTITFIAADTDLTAAARAEGLPSDDPNHRL